MHVKVIKLFIPLTLSDMKSTPRQAIALAPFFAITAAASPIAKESAIKVCGHFSEANTPYSD